MRRSERITRLARWAAAAVLLAATTTPACALNLVMNFNSGASEAPAFDPDGSKLQVLFDYAESLFEGVFEDSHTLTINFWYETLDGNTIGRHSLEDQNGIFSSTYRENEGDIRIDTDVNWFIDDTPSDHSEFNMNQTLWRDISVDQRDDWYNYGADIPDTFEVGYTGSARSGTDAAGKTDMLSVVLHEVGHALGMSSSNYGTRDETDSIPILGGEDDGDYDFHSSWVFGKSLAIETANNSGDDNANIAHLENTFSLLTPSIPGNRRRLPSHGDLMAMAAGQSYGDLDIPRREFYGGTDWNNPGNWTGNEVPETADDVFVRASQGPGVGLRAGLTADGTARDLFVSEGSDVDTNEFKLDLTGDATISDADTFLYINVGGELEADTVTIEEGAQVRMTGGVLDANRLEIESGASLEVHEEGAAVIEVQDRLVNDGLIDTDLTNGLPSTFTFVATGGGSPWDLDGDSGDGFVRANDGDILFNSGGMTDSFDGEIEVGPGFRFHFAEAWTNATGLLDLNGGASSGASARITGGAISFNGGQIAADAGGATFAQIDSDIDISGGTVTIGAEDRLELNGAAAITGGTFDIALDGELQIDGPHSFSGATQFNMTGNTVAEGLVDLNGGATFAGGTHNFTGGVVQVDGDNAVTADTTINAEVFDLDGSAGAGTTWTLDKRLTLNAQRIDTSNNTFNGTLNINHPTNSGDGRLDLALPGSATWTIAGTLNIVGNTPAPRAPSPIVLAGNDVLITGAVNHQGLASIAARVTIAGQVVLQDANSSLSLQGGTAANPNRIEGGTITGPGTLTSTSSGLAGAGAIDAPIYFASAALQADGGSLSVEGSKIVYINSLRTADADGVLDIQGDLETRLTGEVVLNGGALNATNIIHALPTSARTLSGHGQVNTVTFENNGLIAASGGTLQVGATGEFDLDGQSGTGRLHALQGDLVLQGSMGPREEFHGEASVGAGRQLTTASPLPVGTGGVLQLLGDAGAAESATFAGAGLELRGTLIVDTQAAFDAPVTFRAESTTSSLSPDTVLSLKQGAAVQAGAAFTGSATLLNEAGSILSLQDQAAVGFDLVNDGQLRLNSATVQASAGSFQQSGTGLLAVSIAGVEEDQFSQLDVIAESLLAGALEVTLQSNFLPERGDSFAVLTSLGGVVGQFDTLAAPDLAAGYIWDLEYQADQVLLSVVEELRGDFNLDGLVDSIDYAVWREGLGGLFDQADFDDWRNNYGATLAALESSAQVPEPAALALGCLALAGLRRRLFA